MDHRTSHSHQERPPLKRRRESSPTRQGGSRPGPNRPASDTAHHMQTKTHEPRIDGDWHAASELFHPLVQELQRLNEEDPQLASQAARLVGLYQLLWDSYILQRVSSQKLRHENDRLRESNAQLQQERDNMTRRYREQDARLQEFRQALGKFEESITRIHEAREITLSESPVGVSVTTTQEKQQ
ncbi:hypothetical protein BDV40DRAFT_306837 [Aspergillus tamarii]|uniref:Uncharacterized protein n=1 Tax=Aspergillus tamarii TaxID=41984 RepID=A0A5N6UAT0_ASPTM|nr:hypothetical protein BDV40DRAFT_306837 [Aspergillus tamarii]